MSFAKRFIQRHPPKVESTLTVSEAKVLREIAHAMDEDKLLPQETFWPRHAYQLKVLRLRGLLESLDLGEREANGTAITQRGRRALEVYDDQHPPKD